MRVLSVGAILLLGGCRTPPGVKVSFVEVQAIDTGSPGAPSLAPGDFDGDGRIDVFVAAGAVARVWRGTRDRTLAPSPPLPATGGLDNPLAGDLDGDGRLDIVTSLAQVDFPLSGRLLLGAGDGSFAAGGSFDTGLFNVVAIGIGDSDGDGRLELITADRDTVHPLLFASGQPPVEQKGSNVGFRPRLMDDLDGDGVSDLIGRSLDGRLAVSLGRGDGSWPPPMLYGAPDGAQPAFLVAADFDGDRRPDVAVAVGHGVAVWLNRGDGTLRAGLTLRSDLLPVVATALAAGDLDGDGRTDLVIAPAAVPGVPFVVSCGNGDGSFPGVALPPPSAPPLAAPTGLRLVDLDGDGAPEVLVLRPGGLSVHLVVRGGVAR